MSRRVSGLVAAAILAVAALAWLAGGGGPRDPSDAGRRASDAPLAGERRAPRAEAQLPQAEAQPPRAEAQPTRAEAQPTAPVRAAATAARDGRLPLAPGPDGTLADAALTVRVRDSRDRPLAGAEVGVVAPAEDSAAERVLWSGVLDGDTTAIALTDAPEVVEVTAHVPGRRRARVDVALRPPDGRPPSAVLVLEPGVWEVFRVVDRDGRPVTDVRAAAAASDGAGGDEARIRTQGDDVIVLGVGGTLVDVEVTSARAGRAVRRVALPLRASGAELEPLTVGGAGDVRGRLTLADGTPLEGFEVRASTPDVGAEFGRIVAVARTDASGAFVLEHLADAEFDLTLAPDVDPLATTIAAAGPRERNVDWVSPAALVVVDAADETGEALGILSLTVADAPGEAPLGAQGDGGESPPRRAWLLPRGRSFHHAGVVRAGRPGETFLTRSAVLERAVEGRLAASDALRRQLTLRPPSPPAAAQLALDVVGREYLRELTLDVRLDGEHGARLERTVHLDLETHTALVTDLPEGVYRWSVVAREEGGGLLVGSGGTPDWARPLAPETALLVRGHVARDRVRFMRKAYLSVDLSAGGRDGAVARVAIEALDGDRRPIDPAFQRGAWYPPQGVEPTWDFARGVLPLGGTFTAGERLPIGRYRVRVESAGRPPWRADVDLADRAQWVVRPWQEAPR